MKQKGEELFFLNALDSPKHKGNLRFLFCVSSPETLGGLLSCVTGGLEKLLLESLMMI